MSRRRIDTAINLLKTDTGHDVVGSYHLKYNSIRFHILPSRFDEDGIRWIIVYGTRQRGAISA